MIVSYYSIFLQKSILWPLRRYYSDNAIARKAGEGSGLAAEDIP